MMPNGIINKTVVQNKLREIAEEVEKQWEKGKISKYAMEDVLNIQIAASQNLNDIAQLIVEESLKRLLMNVTGELEIKIEDILTVLNDLRCGKNKEIFLANDDKTMDNNEQNQLALFINGFVDKFTDQMRQNKAPRTVCEEFIEFQMAKNCKLEELQIEKLLDALTSAQITLLPENEISTDIQNLKALLEEEQNRRLPKAKNIELKIGENVLLSSQITENGNLQKFLNFKKERNETLLQILVNSSRKIGDYYLPNSRNVILKINVNWDETYVINIFPIHNVVTISPSKAVTFSPFINEFSNFLSTIDYKDVSPIIGVNYESPTVVKDVITTLGLTEIPKNVSAKMAKCALRGFPELIYFIQTIEVTHFINPETAMAELLKEASKSIEKSGIILTIPRCFNEPRKNACAKAAEYANLTNVKFVNEITALAYGYEFNHSIADSHNYMLINYFYPNFTVSIFQPGVLKEKQLLTKQIEFEDFKQWENAFFDSIINNANQNETDIIQQNKLTQLLETMSTVEYQYGCIISAIQSPLLSKILIDYFSSTTVLTINDPEIYIAQGANLAYHASKLLYYNLTLKGRM